MDDSIDADLRRQTEALLEPGDIELVAAIVGTDYGPDDEVGMHRATVEIGGIIADHIGVGDDWYVHSGNDDPEFASNQHQGLTLSADDFLWECQQLLIDGTFDLVFYYEADVGQAGLLDAIEAAGYAATGVSPD